jgi:hypothetical protein
MDIRKFSSPTFLKVNDVRDGPLQLQIAAVNEGKYEKPDLVFETGGRLSLNATNVNTLMRAYGPNSEDWIGKKIELALGKVKYQGELQEAVIVKPISQPIATADRALAPKAVAFNDDVAF